MTYSDRVRSFYAKLFGLPAQQIKFFSELTDQQQQEVGQLFNPIKPNNYVYAVKRDGGLVRSRKKRDFLSEHPGEMPRSE